MRSVTVGTIDELRILINEHPRALFRGQTRHFELNGHPSTSVSKSAQCRFDISRILHMAFLSPKNTEAILTGQQPVDLSIAKLTRMLDLPIVWKDQHALLMN